MDVVFVFFLNVKIGWNIHKIPDIKYIFETNEVFLKIIIANKYAYIYMEKKYYFIIDNKSFFFLGSPLKIRIFLKNKVLYDLYFFFFIIAQFSPISILLLTKTKKKIWQFYILQFLCKRKRESILSLELTVSAS